MKERLLVTGSSGLLGSAVLDELESTSVDVVPFDLVEGNDVLDLDRLVRYAEGCAAIVHLAAVPTDEPGREREIGERNVLGVWNVALAAEKVGVRRVVFSSSVNAMGVFMGQGQPDRFPIDDRQRPCPVTPYSVAKLAGEEILAGLSRRSGITTLALRLPALLHEARYQYLFSKWQQGIAEETDPYWEYGAYLDVRDASRAIVRACSRAELPSHDRIVLVGDEPAHVAPMEDLVLPMVPDHLRDSAFSALTQLGVLVDARRGWELLGIGPTYHWSAEVMTVDD